MTDIGFASRRLHIFLLSLCLLLVSSGVMAATWYVDPASSGGDGTSSAPWPGLQSAFNSGKVAAGDVIHLEQGNYGQVSIQGQRFSKPVRLVSDPQYPAHFSALNIQRSGNISIDGVAVWTLPGEEPVRQIVEINSENIVLSRFDIRGSGPDTNYFSWSKQRWLDASSGIRARGRGIVLRENRVTGTGFGIGTIDAGAKVLGNVIRGFAGDGIRAIGDKTLVQGNYIADTVKVNDNHNDGIQSWSRGPNGRSGAGTVKGLVIDANTIVEWNGPQNHPLRFALQGIGLFDGMFEDLVISNNVIIISAWHGIAVYGGINAKIQNNTLISSSGPSREKPWIAVRDHRNGTQSSGGVVANNIAPRYQIGAGPGKRNNHVLIYPHSEMVFGADGSVRLKFGSKLIGLADAANAPDHDRVGAPRGATVNPGAFQAVAN